MKKLLIIYCIVLSCFLLPLGVWATNTESGAEDSGIEESQPEVVEVVPEEVTEIKIVALPAKTVYSEGDYLELEGLCIRVWMGEVYVDVYNGDMMSVEPKLLADPGEEIEIKVSFETGKKVLTAAFYVQVEEHVHNFTLWEEISESTCTESGLWMRSCECGYEERREVSAKGHRWELEPKSEPWVTQHNCARCDAMTREIRFRWWMVAGPCALVWILVGYEYFFRKRKIYRQKLRRIKRKKER